jgi:dinuclear metal center YbgI/SA1388 family protein
MGIVIRVRDILNFLERGFADAARQYDWDNSGKQLLMKDRTVRKTALALDPTEKVIEMAINEGCELLITHHPLFFGGIKSLDYSSPLGRKVIRAVQSELSIISAHTSLDLADYSLNDYICGLLGAEPVSTFVNEGMHEYAKVAVFVPESHAEAVREAMDRAGGGCIGNYSGCSFSINGTGTFRPGENTNPYIGTRGELERLKEVRVETIIDRRKVSKLMDEVIKVHPYEEVAHDIYRLDMGHRYGLGRVAVLADEMPAAEFLNLVKSKLNADTIRINMPAENKAVSKFAAVTGSGASLWKKCRAAGVDVLLTGDMKHHDALDAAENGIMIIDAGHYETERIFMQYLAQVIKKEFSVETVLIEEQPSIINWR